MSEVNVDPEFLKQRYPRFANSPEVANAVKRAASQAHTEIPRDPAARIQNYLDRFKEIIERKDPEKRENGITALKKILVSRYVVRVEDIPNSYWQAQMRVVRERGESGDWQTLPEKEQLELKRKHLAQTKEDQQGSLEEWIDYLASDKSSFLPDSLKYWAFQGMLRLERYEKGNEEKGIKGRFPERPTGRQRSIKMFPEVNERVLKFIASAYEAQAKSQSVSFRYDISDSARTEFWERLKEKNFRSLYGWGQENMPPISEEEMQTTEGEWVTYKQDSDSKVLTVALQGKGSGWCIAGASLAETYLSNGNLHVYYTHDREGKSTIPRVVIVQKGSQVAEVRGIEWEENVDDYIKGTDVIGNKLRELPCGEEFLVTDADTKRLTAINKKITSGGFLTGDELAFLYEIDRPIKYFGYKKDPRIKELRSQRNPQEDMPIVFECDKSQIARSVGEINKDTKAFVGPLTPGIFDAIQRYSVEHVCTLFPEGKIRMEAISIGGKTSEELQGELKRNKINISSYAEDMMKSKDFVTLKNPENLNLVRLKVGDLGLKGTPTTDEVYARAKTLGLELCPAEVGPHYRLSYANQPMGKCLNIGMKQIADRFGGPDVFRLDRGEDGLWLYSHLARPDYRWTPGDGFLFALSKSEPIKLGLL